MSTSALLAAVIAFVSFSTGAVAQQGRFAGGTDAKAMLERAIAAVKADKAKAFRMFDNGQGGFRDRDLFPFCFDVSTGKVVATPLKGLVGKNMSGFRDAKRQPYGQQLVDAAKEGETNEVSYMALRLGADSTPVPKVALVARVGEIGCAVGYYK